MGTGVEDVYGEKERDYEQKKSIPGYIERSLGGRCPLGFRGGKPGADGGIGDIGPWMETYGEGEVQLLAKRPVDKEPYPVVVTRDGDSVIWTVRKEDLWYGNEEGRCRRYLIAAPDPSHFPYPKVLFRTVQYHRIPCRVTCNHRPLFPAAAPRLFAVQFPSTAPISHSTYHAKSKGNDLPQDGSI